MRLLHRTLILAAVAAAVAAPALAAPVALKANPVDDDGRVTLGDVFDGAGAASNVMIARRVGPSVVFEAGQLQALARQAGLEWDNPNGLRRVAVRLGSAAPTDGPAPAVAAPASAPVAARRAPRAAAVEKVIARNDMVRVAYEVGGVRLSVMGRAMRDAAVGEPVAVMNTTSNRVIDAVAAGPGQAVAGPAAQSVRASALQQFAAR